MIKPRPLLRLEGAAVLLAACLCYHRLHANWWWFVPLLLVPDLSMLGFLVNKTVGASTYNLAHTYTVPLLLAVLWLTGESAFLWLAVVWLAHIGLDRMFGYGLKYETGFKDTHLQRV